MTSVSGSPSGVGSMRTPSTTPPTDGPTSQGTLITVIVVVVIVLVILVVLGIICWNFYFKRRKQSHSLHGQSPSRLEVASPEEHNNSTFRVLSTWEEAINSSEKTKEVEASSLFPAIHVSYCTPDLIAGTSEVEINKRLSAHDASAPEVTFSGADERPRSSEFENPTFNMDLDAVLNNSLFTSPITLDRQLSGEDKDDENKTEETSSRGSSVHADESINPDTHIADVDLANEQPIDKEGATLTHDVGKLENDPPIHGDSDMSTQEVVQDDGSIKRESDSSTLDIVSEVVAEVDELARDSDPHTGNNSQYHALVNDDDSTNSVDNVGLVNPGFVMDIEPVKDDAVEPSELS